MTDQELIDVTQIKAELDELIKHVERLNDQPLDGVLGGASLGPSTELNNFKAALIATAEAARDAKQTEFNDFVGTAV